MSQTPDHAPETKHQCGVAQPAPQGGPEQEPSAKPKPRLDSAPVRHPGVLVAHGLIRSYQLTLSGLIGRHCRHMPSCSEYMDEAMQRHGFWAGGWMGFARICRCQPFGTEGLDFVPVALPERSAWYRPWRYGLWRSTCVDPFKCEPASPMPSSGPRAD